jgi:O-antigen/teichoic acid export membrane protein
MWQAIDRRGGLTENGGALNEAAGHLQSTGRSLLSGWIVVAGGRGLGVGLLLVMQVMLARLLVDPESYGLFVWSSSVAHFGAVLTLLGTGSLAVRFGAYYLARDAHGNLGALFRTLAAAVLTASTALLLVTLVVCAWFWPAGAGAGAQRREMLVVFALALPALALGGLVSGMVQSHRWYGLAFYPERVWRPAVMIVGSLVWYLVAGDLSPAGAAWVFLFSTLLWTGAQAVVFALRYRVQHGGRTRRSPETPCPQLRREWRGTVGFLYAASLLGSATYYVDILMLGSLAETSTLASYFAANRLAHLVGLPMTAISGVLAPRVAAIVGRDNRSELQALARWGAHLSLWPSLLLAALILLLSGPLLGLFGEAYDDAFWLLAILVLGQLCNAIAGSPGVLLDMSGNQQAHFKSLAIAVPVNVVCNLVLIPLFGAMGAAVATLVMSFLVNWLLYRYARRLLGVNSSVLGTQRQI